MLGYFTAISKTMGPTVFQQQQKEKGTLVMHLNQS